MDDNAAKLPEYVKCDHCERLAPLRDALRARETKHPAVKEIGISCPHCAGWTHGYFETPRLVKERLRLQKSRLRAIDSAEAQEAYQDSKRRFERVFNRENSRVKRELGVAQELDVAGSGR